MKTGKSCVYQFSFWELTFWHVNFLKHTAIRNCFPTYFWSFAYPFLPFVFYTPLTWFNVHFKSHFHVCLLEKLQWLLAWWQLLILLRNEDGNLHYQHFLLHLIFFFTKCKISNSWSQLEVDLIDSVARFLESRDMVEEALEVSTDPDYRFELAMQLKN